MPWIKATNRSKLPRNAIVGGRDPEGHIIYVGRARIGEDLLPCSIVPATRSAYTTYKGDIVSLDEFEALCGDSYRWVRATNGEAPGGALIGGRIAEKEEVFVGRVAENGGLIMGSVVPSRGCLLVPITGSEKCFREYDVMVIRARDGCGGCGCKSCVIS